MSQPEIVTLATVRGGVRVALDPSVSIVYPLTACCGASAKGVERGVACRSCYQQIDDSMGMGWVFKREDSNESVDENVASKASLTSWLADHGAGMLAPTIAHTIVLETLARGR